MSSRWRSRSTSEPASALRSAAAVVAILAALAAGGCGAVASEPPAGKAAAAAAPVAPRPAFDHKAHLERGPTCEDCHEGAATRDAAGMPSVEMCMDCHEEIEEAAPPGKRIAEFLDPATKAPRWSAVSELGDELIFAHGKHAAAKVACSECHRGIEESRAVTPALAAGGMDACMDCHAERKASNACSVCHTRIGVDGAPSNHDRLWTARHGQVVRRGAPEGYAEQCSLCHEDSSCLGCHADQAPRDHTQFWRNGPGHGLAAALDRVRCQTCHTSDTCIACHTSNAPRSHRGGWGSPRNRHCIGCHDTGSGAGEGGCSTCHQGTPSHLAAPRKPPGHTPDQECMLCHGDMKHPDNGQNCNACHR